jgi:lipopolysaccharide/colanic/teichoic acid biosynthesis glycosyltransferase
MDIVISLIILTISLPFTLSVLLLIKITQIFSLRPFDPLFFMDERYSHGKLISLYKFNIFKYDLILEARARGELFKLKNLKKMVASLG